MTADDLDFMKRVYRSTREEELAMSGWPDEQKDQFIDMQFNAQHVFYQEHYYDSSFELILFDGEPVGRLYVLRSPNEILIVDIAVLLEHRRKGIGSRILRDLIQEATEKKKAVCIHVEKFNPALALYKRLGFNVVEGAGTDVYSYLEWRKSS